MRQLAVNLTKKAEKYLISAMQATELLLGPVASTAGITKCVYMKPIPGFANLLANCGMQPTEAARRHFENFAASQTGYADLSEKAHQTQLARALRGRLEVSIKCGRVDILTNTHAIEVKYKDGFKGATGQALWYGWETGLLPGLALIGEYDEFITNGALKIGVNIVYWCRYTAETGWEYTVHS